MNIQVSTLPQSPGVYIYKNAAKEILYIGKAKNLRSRVGSYFRTSAELGHMKEKMVPLIDDIETIETNTELEALVLEATLIHKHQPKYNVLLRDDKYYLFIKITKDIPPRIFPVRKIVKDNSRYFGPYSSAHSVRETLKLLRRIFPFREEKDRPRDVIFPHKLFTSPPPSPYKGEGISPETQNIIRFLQGHRQDIIKTLEKGIATASRDLQYEQAALYRDQLRAVQRLEGSQNVHFAKKESFDVISMAHAHVQSAGNILQIRDGKLIGKHVFLLKHRPNTAHEDILQQFILQYYGVAQDMPKKIYIPLLLEDQALLETWIRSRGEPPLLAKTNTVFHTPQRGPKKQLIAMGELNAKQLLQTESVVLQTSASAKTAQDELLKVLSIEQIAFRQDQGHPFRVETYDISNIQGELATASMIVFVDGMPEKKEYRKFKIKLNQDAPTSQHKSNDFAMLEETLTRRLARDDWELPGLIIIDGGKGQLSSAQKALKKSGKDILIISIAKQEEIIYAPPHPSPIRIAYDSPALYLIQRMRDEAHRFTITYHRTLRSKEQIKSALDEVPGIGSKTKKQLLKEFGSVASIKKAQDSDIEKIIGAKKTKTLREHL